MRRVCSECRIPYTPTTEELARYGLSASQDVGVTFYKANTLTLEALNEAKAKNQSFAHHVMVLATRDVVVFMKSCELPKTCKP